MGNHYCERARAFPGPLRSALFLSLITTLLPSLASAKLYAAKTIHSFSSSSGEPRKLCGGQLALGTDGRMYGASSCGSDYDPGGANHTGAIFAVAADGSFQTIYSFSAAAADGTNPEGIAPSGGLVLAPDGNLYGTANRGGPNGTGTVFRLSPDGVVTVVHAFSALVDQTNADGSSPQPDLTVGADGALYGAARYGGKNGVGTVFRISPQGQFKRLAAMNGHSGYWPFGGVILASDGKVYVETYSGGNDCPGGSIASIAPDGTVTMLYAFDEFSGQGGLIEGSDGRLYGGTSEEMTSSIFAITKDGVMTELFRSAGEPPNDVHGSSYSRLRQGADGYLYGTARFDGLASAGVVFRLRTDGSDYSVLYSFTKFNGGGGGPVSGISFDTSGTLFGYTFEGGDSDEGTLFSLAPPPADWGSGPAPQIRMRVHPDRVNVLRNPTETSELRWSSQDARLCWGNGDELRTESAWNGPRKANGEINVLPPHGDLDVWKFYLVTIGGWDTYYLRCVGPTGVLSGAAVQLEGVPHLNPVIP